MVKAVVFFDLDGTLLNAETKLDRDVIQAIHTLQQNDIQPVIATGRNVFEIHNVLKQTGINTLVSANGSYVVNDGKTIFTANITTALITKLTHFIHDNNDSYAVLNSQTDRINRVTTNVKKTYHFINSPIPIINPVFWQSNSIQMMLVFTTPDHDEQYRSTFGDDLSFYRQTPYSLDVVSAGGSKLSGINRLLSLPAYQNVPTYAFGDGNNDLSMFEAVDHPIAMGNALDTVKAASEFVTKSNTEHGIVSGLNHFHLLS